MKARSMRWFASTALKNRNGKKAVQEEAIPRQERQSAQACTNEGREVRDPSKGRAKGRKGQPRLGKKA
jgi:hypothetical protein